MLTEVQNLAHDFWCRGARRAVRRVGPVAQSGVPVLGVPMRHAVLRGALEQRYFGSAQVINPALVAYLLSLSSFRRAPSSMSQRPMRVPSAAHSADDASSESVTHATMWRR